MLPELVALCRQFVTVEPYSSVDGYGQVTYGASASHRCRISGKRRMVRDDRGDEVLSTHTVYFASTPAVGARDRITLSTGDVNSTETGARQPQVLSVGRFPDDFGRVSVVVYLA